MGSQIYLPVGAPLVTSTKFGTESMIGWMRQVTQAVPSGGAAPANANYVLSVANGALANARVATSTATVTVDLSSAGLIKWNALGANLFVVSTTLTDAQVKTLPTTPVSLVAAQGANTLIIPFQMELVADFRAGAYTNVNADSNIVGILASGETCATSYIVNDSSIPRTDVTAFLSALYSHSSLGASQDVELVNGIGTTPFINTITAASLNSAFQLTMNNNGSGNLTGGNAANTLKVALYYGVRTF